MEVFLIRSSFSSYGYDVIYEECIADGCEKGNIGYCWPVYDGGNIGYCWLIYDGGRIGYCWLIYDGGRIGYCWPI